MNAILVILGAVENVNSTVIQSGFLGTFACRRSECQVIWGTFSSRRFESQVFFVIWL